MNQKHAWFALFFTGLAFCGLAILVCSLDRPRSGWWFWAWVVAAVVCVGLMWWVWFRPDLAPDVLAEMGVNYFEREGLCFALLPLVEERRCRLVVFYQNRYATPCEATILIRPVAKGGGVNLAPLRFSIRCEGSGGGQETAPWPIPEHYQGKPSRLRVGADVDYPEGRGRMVRFKDGMQVGSVEDLENNLMESLVTQAAALELTLPTDVDGPMRRIVPSDDLTSPARDITPQESAHVPAVSQSSSSFQEEAAPAAKTGLEPERLTELVSSLEADLNFAEHQRTIHSAKRDEAWARVVMGAVATLGSLAVVTYGVLGYINHWPLPFKTTAIVFGCVLVFAFLKLFVLGVQGVFGTPKTVPAQTVTDLCRDYYSLALAAFGDSGDLFLAVSQYFPLPVFRSYPPDSGQLDLMVKRWKVIRTQRLGIESGVTVSSVNIQEQPRRDRRLVDVTVRVSGPSFGQITFRNVVIGVGGKWFLATPEPVPTDNANMS